MAYNTGNPLGSTSPKDLSDNAKNLDLLVLGENPSYLDRKGVPRKSWKGIEREFEEGQAERVSSFDAAQAGRASEFVAAQIGRNSEFSADQIEREDVFQRFMDGSGWVSLGSYTSGLSIVSHTQTVDFNGQPYQLKPSVPVSLDAPYVTTDNWAVEGLNFKLVGDNSLRQELSDPAAGTELVQYLLRQLQDAVPCSVSERLDQDAHFWSFLTPNQRNNVKANLGTMDCTGAWDKMLAALKQPGNFVYPVTPKIKMPMGVIYFATPKYVDQLILVSGHSSGQSVSTWGTKIKFPADCKGFTFIKGNTGPNQNGADGSILDGLYIEGGGQNSGAADRTKHGIDMQARITVKNSVVRAFSGSGINIVADVSARKNANLWILNTVSLEANGVHGLYVQGGDSNAGIATMINSNNNNRSGIFDASFLGNTYTACHTSGNGRKSQVNYGGNRYYCKSDTLGGSVVPGTDSTVWGLTGPGGVHVLYPDWISGGEYFIGYGYRTTGLNARNVFLGCYNEGGEPPARIMTPAIVVGGIITGGGAGITEDSTALILSGGGRISDFENNSHGSAYTFGLGLKGVNATSYLKAAVDHPSGIAQQWDAAKSVWVWKWANSSELSYMTTQATTITAGRSAPIGGGKQGFPNPIILGDRHFGRAYWTNSSAADPNAGEFARGEAYLFSAVLPGGRIGITCTTAGMAGSTAVFKKFGAIDA